jgi:hypothetical protein
MPDGAVAIAVAPSHPSKFRRAPIGCIFSTAVKPTRSALVAEAKQLVKLARRNGYRLDELLELIESVA